VLLKSHRRGRGSCLRIKGMIARAASGVTNDPIACAGESFIATSAEALPGSAARLALILEERRLPLASALSPQVASSSARTMGGQGPQD
jgi:hypothetical protein